MAEVGKRNISHGQVINIHIHGRNTIEESTVVQGDQVQNKTEITNSAIETIKPGYQATGGKIDDRLEEGMRNMKVEQTGFDATARRTSTQQDRYQSRDRKTSRSLTTGANVVIDAERENQTKISVLRGQAYAHFYNKDYLEARKTLDEINRLQGLEEPDVLLLMTECHLHLGTRNSGKCIDMLRDIILSCGLLKALDVKSWGDVLKKNGRVVGSIILYWVSSAKYETEAADPNDLIEYISSRANDIESPAIILANSCDRSRTIVVDYAIEFLTEMLSNIQNTVGTDPATNALMEGDCVNTIVSVSNCTKNYQKSICFGSKVVEVFEDQFGENASKHQIFGKLLKNLGIAHYNSGHYAAAEQLCAKSIEALKASDSVNEKAKHTPMEITADNRQAISHKRSSKRK